MNGRASGCSERLLTQRLLQNGIQIKSGETARVTRIMQYLCMCMHHTQIYSVYMLCTCAEAASGKFLAWGAWSSMRPRRPTLSEHLETCCCWHLACCHMTFACKVPQWWMHVLCWAYHCGKCICLDVLLCRHGHWRVSGTGPDSSAHKNSYSAKYCSTASVHGSAGFYSDEPYIIPRQSVEVKVHLTLCWPASHFVDMHAETW